MNKKIVLLIDDEVITNHVHQHMLERYPDIGEIYAVNNGIEAMDLLRQLRESHHALPDIIFLDINMPLMNGFQFIEKILNQSEFHESVSNIIMLSSSLNQTDQERAKLLGIKKYFEKPLNDFQIRDSLTGDLIE